MNFYGECALYIAVGGAVGTLVGAGLHVPEAPPPPLVSSAVVEDTPTLYIVPAEINAQPTPLILVLNTPAPTAVVPLPTALELPVAPPTPGAYPTAVPTPTPRRIPIPNPAPARQPAVSPFVPNRNPSGS